MGKLKYRVTTLVYDSGRIVTRRTTSKDKEKSTATYDMYVDEFQSQDELEAFIKWNDEVIENSAKYAMGM